MALKPGQGMGVRLIKIVMLFCLGFSLEASAQGEALYQRCIPCHGESGRKVAMGESRAIAGDSQIGLASKLFAYKEGELGERQRGKIMQSRLQKLKDEELLELAAHIESLGEPSGEAPASSALE